MVWTLQEIGTCTFLHLLLVCAVVLTFSKDWETLAASFESSKDVVIAKVDADAHKELGSRFDVHGYPTLKWFPKGSTTPEE